MAPRKSIRRKIYFGTAGFLFVLVSTLLVTPLFDLTRYQLMVGSPSPGKVVARHAFQVRNFEEEGAVKTARVLSVPPRFMRDRAVEKKAQEEAARMLEDLKESARITSSGLPAQVPAWADENVEKESLHLTDPDWAELRKAIRSLIHEFLSEKGLLQEAATALQMDIHRHPQHEIRYINEAGPASLKRVRGAPELLDLKSLSGYLNTSIDAIYPNVRGTPILTAVVLKVARPNQFFDVEHFRIESQKALADIGPIWREYQTGDLILREGQTVTESHLVAIREMQQADRTRLTATGLSAFAILSLLTLLLLQYLRIYQPDRLKDTGWMWFIVTLFVLMLGIARVLWTLTDSRAAFAFAIPAPAYAMLVTIFYRPRVAMLSSPFLAVAIALLYGSHFQLMLVLTITCVASVFVVRHTRTMGDIVKTGLFLGLISPIAVLASHFVMIDSNVTREVLYSAAAGGISGLILVPFLTFGLVHFIPILFGLPSDFKILELSDLNHPLLRQMLLEAPGSYQHSQTVSILAEAACESIGANSLLARVGSYYHDIGKMKKAEYFTENQKYIIDEKGEIIGKETKEIKPTLYASVLKSHVKLGVELAKEARLPRIIIDFIEQHHGKSLMKSIYDLALSHAGEDETIERESFMYPGPKPRYKETAVVMLADTVEAAVRSLNNPTPHRIEEEVRRLIQIKVSDGELDESPITLKDLRKVEEAFTGVLTSMYHTRVAYPTDDELKKKEKGRKEENGS